MRTLHWNTDTNITMRQGTEHDSDVFDWLCEGPFRQIAFPDMHRGNPVAHGKNTDRHGLAKFAEREREAG
jgi:hypothetical protein